jgi:hypothetical protein
LREKEGRGKGEGEGEEEGSASVVVSSRAANFTLKIPVHHDGSNTVVSVSNLEIFT